MNYANVLELKRIAFRSLARHKVKTLLTCAGIMVSAAVFIWMRSWLGGMFMESRRSIINYEMGSAKLQTKLYFDKKDEMPAYENFSNWKMYADALDAAGYNTAPRYDFSGSLFSWSGSAPVVIHGVIPEKEARMLAYPQYVEFGRFIKDGEFGVVLGVNTADKLKVGVPTRPTLAELDDLVGIIASNSGEGEFVRSLYINLPAIPELGETKEIAEERVRGRMTLKRDLPQADLEKLWVLCGDAGRNDVRISTVIDYKMVPDTIRKDKWDADLLPLLTLGEKSIVEGAYEYDDLLEAYMLIESDPEKLDAALQAMIRIDYSGAVRHVNQVIDAKVVGVINSPDAAINFNVGYMPLDALQGDQGMALEGRVTELLIRDKKMGVADMTSKIETKAAITAALSAGLAKQGLSLSDELEVFTWEEYNKDYLGYESMEYGATGILSGLLFFLALIGISNTMLLAILERTKEIGMMRAMGMTRGQLIFVYMTEAFFLGLLGSVLGVILGCAINYPMVKYGVSFGSMVEAMNGQVAGLRSASIYRSMWDIPLIIWTGVAATVLSSLMAFFPTRRAVKMEITESLRFE
jgi:ABC-type lipoprotein release transport system permease subunit